MNTALDRAISFFTDEKRSMSLLSVSCGTADRCLYAARGSQEAEISENTLFDLASLTKLFTALTLLHLTETGMIDLQKPAAFYAPQYTRLDDVSVDSLLGFEVGLQTDGRIDACTDREAGLQALYRTTAQPQGTGRYYSDIHAMVLGDVISAVCSQPLDATIRELILEPLGMRDTFAHVPENRIMDCESCDNEHRIEGERYIVRSGIPRGTPHDPKARLLSPDGQHLCGHAGLFSSRRDMVRLCQAILRGEVLQPDTLKSMSRNRLGRPLPQGGWTQYLGSLCYVKHPCQYYSEIPVYMGHQAIGLSGFTGKHISIDPENGIFALFLGNRVQNRLSILLPPPGRERTDYGLQPDGTGTVIWPDGRAVCSSVDYVHLKDEHLHSVIAQELQLSPVLW